MDYASGYKVEGNDFAGSYTSWGGSTGISISNSGAAENKIYRNTFSDLSTGIATNGMNSSGSNYTSSGLQFICNAFNDNGIDIGALGSIRPSQGSLVAGADNDFNNGNNIIYYPLCI